MTIVITTRAPAPGEAVSASLFGDPVVVDLTNLANAANMPPGQIIARGKRNSNFVGIDGTERGIMRLDAISIVAGRRYMLLAGPSRFSPATATDICRAQIRYSEAGTATTASTVVSYVEAAGSVSQMLMGGFTAVSTNQITSVLFTGQRATGSSATTWISDSGGFRLKVIDLGVDVGDTGINL